MTTTITAIYEQGVLRPLTPLALPERAQVQVQIITSTPDDARRLEWERLTQACRAAGLTSPANVVITSLVPPERREELMRLTGNGKPLSEIVIENRQDRV